MTFALAQLCALAAFCAVGALCGACLALVSFRRNTKKRAVIGFIADFFAFASPGTLIFLVSSCLCDGDFRPIYLVFFGIGAIISHTCTAKPLIAARNAIISACKKSPRLKKLAKSLIK